MITLIQNRLFEYSQKILAGSSISQAEALSILQISKQTDMIHLLAYANELRQHFKGSEIELCSIINAKSGNCSEDCSFCPQSIHSESKIETYPLKTKEEMVTQAMHARENGAKSFGIVTSGASVTGKDMEVILQTIREMAEKKEFMPCASLGSLTYEQALEFKQAGLIRYHHNLETAESFFPQICSTHSYQEKIATIENAKKAGLEICSGALFGLGESLEQRVELAFALKKLDVDNIPLNFLNPIPGTRAENQKRMSPFEIFRTIAMFRFVNPTKTLRIGGGREVNLRSVQGMMYLAGANATLTGNYLTTQGRSTAEDIQELKDLELTYCFEDSD